MELKIKKLAIDRVLRWGMEVSLQTIKIGLPYVLVKQADCFRLKVVILLTIFIFENYLELLAGFFELELCFWINVFVLEFEYIIFEFSVELDVCL